MLFPDAIPQSASENFSLREGIYIPRHASLSDAFEIIYNKVLHKERRVFNDIEAKALPKAFSYNLHQEEWLLRAKTLKRFRQYIRQQKRPLRILDVGCGNGWFSAKLARFTEVKVIGINRCHSELEQAVRVFNTPNLKFIYADANEDIFLKGSFDMIILNDTIQFFPHFRNLINHLLNYLDEGGEIHIMDSPFYRYDEVDTAREAAERRFQHIGCDEMMDWYYFHTLDELDSFDFNYQHNPRKITQKIRRKFSGSSSAPNPWIRIRK